MNCEVQGYCAIATVRIDQSESRRVGTFGVCISVYPSVTFARALYVNSGRSAFNRQIQSNNRIATVRIDQSESRRVGTFCVCISVYPSVTFARALYVNSGRSAFNRQIQSNNRIATIRIDQSESRRVGACGVCNSVYPSVTFARAL